MATVDTLNPNVALIASHIRAGAFRRTDWFSTDGDLLAGHMSYGPHIAPLGRIALCGGNVLDVYNEFVQMQNRPETDYPTNQMITVIAYICSQKAQEHEHTTGYARDYFSRMFKEWVTPEAIVSLALYEFARTDTPTLTAAMVNKTLRDISFDPTIVVEATLVWLTDVQRANSSAHANLRRLLGGITHPPTIEAFLNYLLDVVTDDSIKRQIILSLKRSDESAFSALVDHMITVKEMMVA